MFRARYTGRGSSDAAELAAAPEEPACSSPPAGVAGAVFFRAVPTERERPALARWLLAAQKERPGLPACFSRTVHGLQDRPRAYHES